MATVGFDLDLTLCDTRPGIVAAFAALAAETGVPVDGELIVTRLGPKLESELTNWFPAERIAEAAGIYRHHYDTTCRTGTTPLPGAVELVDALIMASRALAQTSGYGRGALANAMSMSSYSDDTAASVIRTWARALR